MRTKLSVAGVQVLCTNRPQIFNGYLGSTSSQPATGMTYRQYHKAGFDMVGVRLVFQNWYCANAANGDIVGPNTITVAGSIETGPIVNGVGTLTPVTFEGAATVDIAPGGDVVSDIVYVAIAKDAAFWTRSYVKCTAGGGGWPVGIMCQNADGEGQTNVAAGQDNDCTASGAFGASGPIFSNFGKYAYGPSAIIGVTSGADASPGWVIAGDSISLGYVDWFDSVGGGNTNGGFLLRAADAYNVGRVHLSRANTRSTDFLNGHAIYRIKLARFANQAIIAYGANEAQDNMSLATYQSQMNALADLFRAHGVQDVYACTVTPYPTSTDNYTTLANQTPAHNNDKRLAYNAWLRTIPAKFTGVFDVAAAVEYGGAAAPSGKWWVTGVANATTTDGLHPTTASHIRMAAAILGQGIAQWNGAGSLITDAAKLNWYMSRYGAAGV